MCSCRHGDPVDVTDSDGILRAEIETAPSSTDRPAPVDPARELACGIPFQRRNTEFLRWRSNQGTGQKDVRSRPSVGNGRRMVAGSLV